MNLKEKYGIAGDLISDDQNTLTSWNQLHYGMFIHLGLYSLLGGTWKGKPIKEGYSEQIQMWANIPNEEYSKLMDKFTLENFDPEKIVSLAKNSGMKYLVITSKHHDGFCLFDTKTTDYNVVKSTPYGKDIVKLLADECEKQGLKFGLYYSLVDWHAGHEFDFDNNNKIPSSMEPLIKEQLTELMTNYGDIIEVWFDMSYPTPKQSKEFSDIVRKYQPNAAINGRIWNNQGDFRTLGDNQIPTTSLEGLWQTPASIYNETWSYREWQERENSSKKARELLEHLISVRARGGNYLLNIGPKEDGSVIQFEQDVLKNIGKWIRRHPKAVLGSNGTQFNKHTWGEVTVAENNLYLHVFSIPKNGVISLKGLLSQVQNVYEDGTDQPLEWHKHHNELDIKLPTKFLDPLLSTIKIELTENLYILPQNLIEKDNDGWIINSHDIEKTYNFVDEGYYNSLKQANIKQLVYISTNDEQNICLDIKGKANSNLNYLVTVDDQEKVVSGADLTKEKIVFEGINSTKKPTLIMIKLLNPKNKYQDIELEINELIIKSYSK